MTAFNNNFNTAVALARRGGRVVRWSCVNFQCRGVLLVWIRVGQGPTALAVGAGGGCLDIFTLIYSFSSLSPSLWETTRYRLKYCLNGSLSPKTTNQPTNPGKKSNRKDLVFVIDCRKKMERWENGKWQKREEIKQTVIHDLYSRNLTDG